MFLSDQLVHTPDGLGRIIKTDEYGQIWVRLVFENEETVSLFNSLQVSPALEVETASESIQPVEQATLQLAPCDYCGEPATERSRYDSYKNKHVDLCAGCLTMVKQFNMRKRQIASMHEDRKTLEAVRAIGKKPKGSLTLWGKTLIVSGAAVLAGGIAYGVITLLQ